MGFGKMRLEMHGTKLVLKCFCDTYFLSCCRVCLYGVFKEIVGEVSIASGVTVPNPAISLLQ